MLSSARAFSRSSLLLRRKNISSSTIKNSIPPTRNHGPSYHITTSTTRNNSNMSLQATIFDSAPFWKSTGVFAGANLLGLAINLVFPHAHYHVDLLGTGAFALAAAAPSIFASTTTTTQPAPARIQWSGAAVTAWSVKLAAFLVYRVWNTKHDARLDEQLSHPTSAAGFWFISFLWGVVCSLPHALGTTSSLAGNSVALRAGMALFGAGWVTETLADYQKWTFKQNHPGQFCGTGLWSVVQHPNWLGNLMLWSGIFVMNVPALIEPITAKNATLWQKVWGCRRVGLALLGPAFMWLLFDAQATGKILDDTRQANLKKYGYGEDPTFTNYIDTTPLILPNNPLRWFQKSAS